MLFLSKDGVLAFIFPIVFGVSCVGVLKVHNNRKYSIYTVNPLHILSNNSFTELQIIFLFLNEIICCDPSLEPSQRDGSNDGSQNMILWRNMANYL